MLGRILKLALAKKIVDNLLHFGETQILLIYSLQQESFKINTYHRSFYFYILEKNPNKKGCLWAHESLKVTYLIFSMELVI